MPSRHWFVYGRELSGHRPASRLPRRSIASMAYAAYYRYRRYRDWLQFERVRHAMHHGHYAYALRVLRNNINLYYSPAMTIDNLGYYEADARHLGPLVYRAEN